MRAAHPGGARAAVLVSALSVEYHRQFHAVLAMAKAAVPGVVTVMGGVYPTVLAEEALKDIYRRLRPGDPPTAANARALIKRLFFDPKRYDLGRVGRYKIHQKLGVKDKNDSRILTKADLVAATKYLLRLKKGKVRRYYPCEDRLVVEGVNMVKRHMKPRPNIKQAGIIEREAPISVSDVMLICTKCKNRLVSGFSFWRERPKSGYARDVTR
jgi:ribosomal protein L24